MVKHSAKFYSPDGALYARSSRIDSVMELPYFRLTCDDNLSYNVHYKKSIRESLSCMTPSQKQFYDVVRNFKITDVKARPLSKLCNYIYKKGEEMEKDSS